ncbi:PREDICTED: large proline-rich protein BAG6 isoform X1 [Camelina sativa]|uniref:Large proline-rich protein BAG6 isoform X1 n=1 Tax=Camelina sativa TaxID=90675 RepID=A0ABM0X7V0_CAMSA|nr:PREDICTED: large proline-rich protein BAG6 isoform X1 [Camelina sativa]
MEDQPINQCSSSNNAFEKTPESTLELNIKTLDSQTYTFQVNKNETVSLFKEKIASETGVPVGQQRLIFRGRVLKDDHPLSEYHLENGHTLHLVVRQPAESVPTSGTPSEGATANDGNSTNGGPSRNGRHVSHSVVLGSFNVGDQTEGIVPDLSRVIGAVLNSFGVGGQHPLNNSTIGTPSMPSNLSSHAPPVNTSDGAPGIGGQNQAAGHFQPRQAFPGVSFQASMPHVVQIPITAATAIPIPSFLMPIPDSLDTLMEFINRMEQALSQNGYQPDTSSATSGGRPTEELPRSRRGAPTPEALSVVLRNAQHLLSGLGVSSLSHIARRLEQDGSSSDPTLRAQIQTEAVQVGLAMQHLGAFLLELGRTILTLRMAQSPELSYVNAGPAVYISPSGPNPIMAQPFPHQTSSLFTGAAVASNPVTGPVGLGTPQRHINIHIHAGTSGSSMMSSVGNQRSNGGQGNGENITSSVRGLPVTNIIAAAVPPGSTSENISTGVQPGLDGSVSVAQINARIRELVNNMQGRNQIPSGTEALERDMSTGHGVAGGIPEQPTNIAASCTPESSSGALHDLPSERRNSVYPSQKELSEDLGHPALAKDISSTTGQSSAPSGESPSNGDDATGDAKETKKATPQVATATPLGLGLGGLDRKKRSKQPKVVGENEDSGTSATVEGVQQSSGSSGQQLLQSLFSGSSRSDETGLRRGQGSDDQLDVSSAMSQVMESPVLDGLLAGVSRQAGVDSPNMLRNMLQQFTQNPQIMNTVQQIAQQVDGQEIENMMSGGAQGEGGGFDFSRMVQQMMPLVSRAFSQGGPSPQPATQQPDDLQPFQVNVQSLAQMIEHSDPPEDVFRAMVENAAVSQDDLVNELCCDEVLSHEYAELLRRDIEGLLKDDQGP